MGNQLACCGEEIEPQETGFLEACAVGDEMLVEQYLKDGESLTIWSKNSKTLGFRPLHMAISENREEVVKILLKAGAGANDLTEEVKELGPNGLPKSALAVAAEFGSKETFFLLLNEGADINFKRKNGETILHSACSRKNKVNVIILSHLFSKSFDPNALTNSQGLYGDEKLEKETSNCTPYHYLALNSNYTNDFKAFIKSDGNDELENGQSLNVIKLMSLYKGKRISKADFLTLKHETIKSRDEDLLLKACWNGEFEEAEQLISKGVNIQSFNKSPMKGTYIIGFRPLHLAIAKNHGEIVKMLLKKGAGVNDLSEEIIAVIPNGYPRSPLFVAGEYGCEDLFFFLLEQGADLDYKRKTGDTILHGASYETVSLKVIKFLFSKSFDPNEPNYLGYTPFHCIVGAVNDLDIFYEFLLAGGDYMRKDNSGHNTVISLMGNVGKFGNNCYGLAELRELEKRIKNEKENKLIEK